MTHEGQRPALQQANVADVSHLMWRVERLILSMDPDGWELPSGPSPPSGELPQDGALREGLRAPGAESDCSIHLQGPHCCSRGCVPTPSCGF